MKEIKNLEDILIILIGILMLLPLLGISALGSLSGGIAGWIVPLAVLAIGVMRFLNK